MSSDLDVFPSWLTEQSCCISTTVFCFVAHSVVNDHWMTMSMKSDLDKLNHKSGNAFRIRFETTFTGLPTSEFSVEWEIHVDLCPSHWKYPENRILSYSRVCNDEWIVIPIFTVYFTVCCTFYYHIFILFYSFMCVLLEQSEGRRCDHAHLIW